jgi:4-carboxymuconolactone decarboxylase
MSQDDERRERGEDMFQKVYGAVVPLPPREGRSTFVTNTIDQLFAEVWSRDILSVRERRLLILGVVAALGETGIAEIQLRAALANGELTAEQAEEFLIFIVNYVGYPRASALQAVLRKVLPETAAKA